jgi:hypothetical protein
LLKQSGFAVFEFFVAESHFEILRKLRVAFTAAELQLLQTFQEFERALRECQGSAEECRKLIALGGALLAEKNRPGSRLGSRIRRP